MGLIAGNVRNRDTDDLRNGFLQQFQPFIAKAHEKGCQAGDIPARTSETFNEARLDRIGALTRHNYGDRLGRIHGRLDYCAPACRHDDIDPESHQLGRELREPIELLLRITEFEGDVLSFSVAEL